MSNLPIYFSLNKVSSIFVNSFLLQNSIWECQNIQGEKSDINRRKAREVQGGNNLAFTQESYNVVIPENSLGKVYAVPSDLNTKMGISLENSGIENYENLNIRFRIRSGDTDDFFKAEAESCKLWLATAEG